MLSYLLTNQKPWGRQGANRLSISSSNVFVMQEVHAYRLEHVLQPFLHQLMRSADQLKAIDLVKFCCYPCSKQPACPSRTDGPRFRLLWIAPHEVTEGALMGDLTHALYCPYLWVVQFDVKW